MTWLLFSLLVLVPTQLIEPRNPIMSTIFYMLHDSKRFYYWKRVIFPCMIWLLENIRKKVIMEKRKKSREDQSPPKKLKSIESFSSSQRSHHLIGTSSRLGETKEEYRGQDGRNFYKDASQPTDILDWASSISTISPSDSQISSSLS